MLYHAETSVKRIEDAFKEYTNRDDVAIVLINQYIANMIRHLIANYTAVSDSIAMFVPAQGVMACLWRIKAATVPVLLCLQPIPAILEIPSKEHPYDPSKDSIMTRVKIMFGGDV